VQRVEKKKKEKVVGFEGKSAFARKRTRPQREEKSGETRGSSVPFKRGKIERGEKEISSSNRDTRGTWKTCPDPLWLWRGFEGGKKGSKGGYLSWPTPAKGHNEFRSLRGPKGSRRGGIPTKEIPLGIKSEKRKGSPLEGNTRVKREFFFPLPGPPEMEK